MNKAKQIRVGISIGDINGVGPEVVMKTFSDARMLDFCTPIIFAPSKVIAYYRKTLQLKNFHFLVCDDIKEAKHKNVNILASTHGEVPIKVGTSTKEAGQIAMESLKAATDALKEGNIDVLVTAPINKDNIQSEAFNFPGHTEYLKECFSSDEALMLMVNDDLKVAVATGHIPLSEVANTINKDLISSKVKALNTSLKMDFMIRKPKIAVLALNPHAGDNGLIGSEENDYINDTIDTLQEENVLAYGPFPADGFFGTGMQHKYDAILAMYHDQGLVPFKTLSFQNGVNFTASLPYVRTSPDHGTAYSIAGKGEASEDSFRKAVFEAIDIFRSRVENLNLDANKIDAKEVAQFLNQRRQSYNQKNKPKPGGRRFENKTEGKREFVDKKKEESVATKDVKVDNEVKKPSSEKPREEQERKSPERPEDNTPPVPPVTPPSED